MTKEILFSITKKDLDVQFFRAGGKGGQHQNKTSSACRIVHKPSGATGESRDQRSQTQNKKLALQRLVASKEFKSWVRMEAAAKLQGFRDTEDKVNQMMKEKNLKIEIGDENGEWKEVPDPRQSND